MQICRFEEAVMLANMKNTRASSHSVYTQTGQGSPIHKEELQLKIVLIDYN